MDEEFNGVGHVYLRPGQWVAVKATGRGASVTLSRDGEGNIMVVSLDRHGGAETKIRFDPEGKVIDDGSEVRD